MPLPTTIPADQLGVDVLFPEDYARSARTITRDFVLFGALLAGTAIVGALVNLVYFS